MVEKPVSGTPFLRTFPLHIFMYAPQKMYVNVTLQFVHVEKIPDSQFHQW